MSDSKMITAHISTLDPSVRKIYKALRALARKAMPGAVETFYHNAIGYGTGSSSFDRVCYIMEQEKGYVNFGFFFGADLPDPKGLIEGAGKRMRHVKVRTMEQVKDPALEELIKAAWKKGGKDIEEWRGSLKKKRG